MKCPKCGYNSFETYDACQKCGSDLVAFKQSLGIRPILYPPGFVPEREELFAGPSEQASPETASAEVISWDIPEERPESSEEPFTGFDLDFGDADSPSEGFRFDMEEYSTTDAESSLFEPTSQAIDGPDVTDAGFDLDDFLVRDQLGGPPPEEGKKQAAPALDLSDDWPSFLDEEKKGEK